MASQKAAARFNAPLPAELERLTPAKEQQILSLDATGLLRAMSTGELSSVQVTSLYIRRARQQGQRLNFTTDECFGEAIAAAAASDARRAKGEAIGPLEGLPISLKDCFDQKGFDSTTGIQARVNKPFAEDGLFGVWGCIRFERSLTKHTNYLQGHTQIRSSRQQIDPSFDYLEQVK